jgi:hypothetical protein
MANNDALVQRIVEIIRTHANPKQGLANLKQSQNIVPGIVAIIKKAVDQNSVKVVNYAPTNDVAKAITKMIQNSVKIPSNVVPISIQKLEVGGEPEVAAQVVKQANASDVAAAISKLIRNSVKLSSPVTVASIQTLVAGRQTPTAVQAINQANANDVAAAITKLIQNSVRIPPAVAEAAAETMVGPAHESVLNKLRKMFEPKPKTPNQGLPRPSVLNRFKKMFSPKNKMVPTSPANQPNFMEPTKNNQGRPKPPPSGYILTTRTNNTGVPKTGWYRNKGPVVPFGPAVRPTVIGPSSNEERAYRRRRHLLGPPPPSAAVADNSRELMELMRRRRAARMGTRVPVAEYGYGGGPPPLPLNQQRAINNVGGANMAMNTVVQVPGGAPEIAKAAEALNESRGNMTYAITVKGASPAAVAAVQKLGGPNNAVNVLEGLNTMSKTHGTRKRKAARRIARPKKRKGPRIAELNRVINAVKKQRLISLVAHNVTKTHNIHPNDEKLKKYYKKVLKANILRTPFAKIARKAARKRVQ